MCIFTQNLSYYPIQNAIQTKENIDQYLEKQIDDIIGENKYIDLTAPTLKKKSSQMVKNVEIDNKSNWKCKLFKNIEINYEKVSTSKNI